MCIYTTSTHNDFYRTDIVVQNRCHESVLLRCRDSAFMKNVSKNFCVSHAKSMFLAFLVLSTNGACDSITASIFSAYFDRL